MNDGAALELVDDFDYLVSFLPPGWEAKAKELAHASMNPSPARTEPDKVCGECHPEITQSAKTSLHTTLATFPRMLSIRANPEKSPHIEKGRQNHCSNCHAGCGECHVSRPDEAEGGLIRGHLFSKRPDPVNQCTGCHGSRIGNEFFGKRGIRLEYCDRVGLGGGAKRHRYGKNGNK